MPDETYGCHSRRAMENGVVLAAMIGCGILGLIVGIQLASFPSGDGGGASAPPSSYIQEPPE